MPSWAILSSLSAPRLFDKVDGSHTSLFLKFLEIPDLVETVGSLVEPVFANSSLLDWLQKMMWWRAGDGSSFWLATPHVPRFGVASSFQREDSHQGNRSAPTFSNLELPEKSGFHFLPLGTKSHSGN